jgi:outer membrane protein OmpA-like peptidoglycan-associated protein
MFKKFMGTAALVICAASLASTAQAEVLHNKVVRDARGQVVHAIKDGTCVRTDWQAGTDVCAPVVVQKTTYVAPPAPPPPPPPQIVQRRVEILSGDEKTVYFPFDSAELTGPAQAKLDTVATKLSGASSVRGADIVGFADRLGSNSYNMTLSQKRAKAVKDYLAGRGYLNTNIARVRGLGESNPTTSCNPKAKREHQIACLGADRKVELEVQYTETKVEQKLIQPATYAPAPAYAPAPIPAPQGDVMYRQNAPAQ